MWILISLFGLSLAVVAWSCFGYYVHLRLVALLRPREENALDCPNLPLVSVVVPCLDEREQIVEKYHNLRDQGYPKDRLEIVFADGGSRDDTLDLLERQAADDPTVKIIRCPKPGKVNQLNYVLPQLRGEIVVNTDTDGRMEPDTLSELVREFYRDPRVDVVGAFTYPSDALDIEQCYWLGQNRGRLLETDYHAASIVIAVCYAFRRSLIEKFPDDVVADDIHVAFEANTRGRRAIYSRRAVVRETRGPRSLWEFFPHKFRKSNAFLREMLRFLYRLPEMPRGWRLIYASKLLQLSLLPIAGLLVLLVAGSLLTLGRYDVVIMGFAFLLALFAITVGVFHSVKVPAGPTAFDLATFFRTFVYSNVIMLLTGLSYPFYHQTSRYRRLAARPAEQPNETEQAVDHETP